VWEPQLAPIIEHKLDTVQVAGRVLEVARQLRLADERPLVRVDVIGVGAGVYDQLYHAPEVETVAVNVAETPVGIENQERFAQLRDQMWFGLADWLKDGGAIPDDPKLEAELVAPTYTFDMRGRIKVDTKDKMKERLGRSPDRADGLGLAVVSPQGSYEAWSGYYHSTLKDAEAQELREMPAAGVRNPQAPAQLTPTLGNRTIVTVRGDDEAANDAMLVRLLAGLARGEPIPWETLQPAHAERLDKMIGATMQGAAPADQRVYLMERRRYTQVKGHAGASVGT